MEILGKVLGKVQQHIINFIEQVIDYFSSKKHSITINFFHTCSLKGIEVQDSMRGSYRHEDLIFNVIWIHNLIDLLCS